jgi:hypothetical protein
MRLLAKLHTELTKPAPSKTQNLLGCGSPTKMGKDHITFLCLSEWLGTHGLGEYVYGFTRAGLDDLE